MTLLDLAHSIGLSPKKASSTQGGEYKSGCPRCGGKDRFFIQPSKQMKNCLGYYRCRQCECSGDTIQFAREFCGLDFKQAAEIAHATIPENQSLFKLPRKQFTPTKINPTSELWTSRANAFVTWTHQQIMKEPAILEMLHKRGLPIEAVINYKMGWNPSDIWRTKDAWGLESHDDPDAKLWLAKGIVIPSIENNGNVNRIKIRRTDWKNNDAFGKYIAVSGSMVGLTIIGDRSKDIMIVVESELDAYALHHSVGNYAFIVSVGSYSKNPDLICNYIAEKVPCLLICHDNDEAGAKMLDKWVQLYPHAQGYPTPIGKDIGEAIEQGFQIRPWILEGRWLQSPHLELIRYILHYSNQERITKYSYRIFEEEIALGPTSTRAKNGEFIKGLQRMRQYIERQSTSH